MFLKRLELQGFKSFADKTVLEFMPGITTVIGPNGSGKSNISDSIRWVLGEQSMKSLRGSKSEDIIFAGTQNRKSLGFAEASIVIDNSDGKLPIEYNEVVVTRRIFRNGDSGYFINKVPCRLKDVLELFMDTGIGKDGYSIIGQGKIDEILSNKSEDRRNIFEEAAGIVKYRARKAESEKKLEQTKLNLLRINDILSEIESTIEPLKNQSEKAKKYLSIRDELKSIEIGLFLYNIDTYKAQLEDITRDIDIILSEQKDEESRLSVLQNLKENLKTELEEIMAKIEETQNLGFESEKRIEQINSDISVAETKIANNAQNKENSLKEIEELNKRNQEISEEKENRLNKKENLIANREKFAKELEEKEKSLNEISSKFSDEERKIEEKKQKLEQNTENKYENREKINTIEINNENLKKRSKTVQNEITDTISSLDEKRMLKSELLKTFNEKELKRNECKKRLSEIKAKKDEASLKITEYENKINKLLTEMRIKDSKQKFLTEMEKEKEGYSRAVKALLLECEKNSSLNKGVEGVLANLITVPAKYQTAIETVLGQILQNIVTETEEDAKKLIEHLRKNNLGRASFLPLSAVKGKKVELKNNSKGILGVASDLIETDKKYEGIILNLLGKTVVVENMDVAISLARENKYSFKIVTLQGDIINPSGAMSGGSVSQKTSNIIGRQTQIKELEKEISKLTQEIKDITNEKEEYESSIEGVLEEITSVEQTMQEIEIEYATEKQRIESLEEAISGLETRLEKLKSEIKQIDETTKANEKQKTEIEETIEKIEKENVELNTEIQAFAEKDKENQKYIDDLNFDITNLKISLSSFDESSNSMQEILERIETELQTNTNKITNKKDQIEQMQKENEELKQKIQELNEQIEKIRQDVKGSSETVEKLKQEKLNKNNHITKTESEIEEKYEILETIKNQANKLEVKKSKIDVELEQIVNKMWEDYEITPNTAGDYKRPSNIQETSKQVKHLRDEIKSLGSINIDSIEEYKQTKERYDYMCEQRLDLENSSTKLKKVIQDMTKIMKEQFETQFKIINKNFGEVFIELFGGGKAELKLTDEEDILNCGIEIEAQPPGKKLQNMSLLSGGERAFTAIALLFAILKINPAPFCVLDEIEAALDDVNVYRFADYLKKFTKETQFLVITHRKGTMEAADSVYGITMEESGISKLLSMKLEKK